MAVGLTLFGQPPAGNPNPPGSPLPGLSTEQLKAFDIGKDDFEEIEGVEDGLGPAFNGVSCVSCHSLPAAGGTGNASVLRAGRTDAGRFVEPQGGSLVHLFATKPECQPQIPRDASIVVRRIPTPLFGAGLVEAIPDDTLRSLESRPNRNGDQLRGRAALVLDPVSNRIRVGRFGWKAQQATLLAFAGDAYRNEMGITNDLFPDEVGTGLSASQLAACDPVAKIEDKFDPITQTRGIDRFTNFMRFLAPLPRGMGAATVRRGEDLFDAIGCTGCHVPSLLTGPNSIPALHQRPVNAYSDFLLHDIGTGDGVEMGAAKGNEFRTAPLWGLRSRKLLLHDGRAFTPDQAIQLHGGTASPVLDRYRRLPPPDRQALVDFLSTL